MSSEVMDKIVKLNSQSAGRDRLFRLMQYGSRFIWAYFENHKYDKDMVNKLKNLEYSLSTARKLYRFGRSADLIYAALNTMNLEDVTLRYTLSLSKINMALFFLSDHMLWIDRVGLATIDKPKWSRINNKLWLYYLVTNLIRDLYEILCIVSSSTSPHPFVDSKSRGILSKLSALHHAMMEHKDVTIDTIKNACDVCIPLTNLGYLSFSPGTIGLLGAISSIAGMIPLISYSCKLAPS